MILPVICLTRWLLTSLLTIKFLLVPQKLCFLSAWLATFFPRKKVELPPWVNCVHICFSCPLATTSYMSSLSPLWALSPLCHSWKDAPKSRIPYSNLNRGVFVVNRDSMPSGIGARFVGLISPIFSDRASAIKWKENKSEGTQLLSGETCTWH